MESRYYLKRYKGVIIAIIIGVALFFALWKLDVIGDTINRYLGYISPVLYGIAIAYLLNPITVFFENLLKKRFLKSKREKIRQKADKKAKNLSIAISITIGILTITVLLLLIIPSLLESIIEFSGQAGTLITNLLNKIEEWTSKDGIFGDQLQNYAEVIMSELKNWLGSDTLGKLAESALELITSSVSSVAMFLYNFLVGIIVAVYALAEKKKFVSLAKKFTYVLLSPKKANHVIDTARHGHNIFGGFMSGVIIDSAIVWIICFIFCICANMPYPLLLSTVVGITNIIPFFGPFIGGIPTALIVLMVSPIKGLIYILFIIVLQQIDGNIISTKILGNTTGVSEFWVTFALLLFGGMFGFVGMMIGVPLFAVISYLLRDFIDNKAKSKGISENDDFYYLVERYDEETQSFVMHTPETQKERRDAQKPFSFKSFFSKFKKKH